MEAFIDMKKLILVTSPPACGKTFISKQVAKALHNWLYPVAYTHLDVYKRQDMIHMCQ